jgi:hypothetical protein
MSNIFGRQVVVLLTNKSGGAVVAGDVVVIDSANDTAFTTTTSAGATVPIGVAQESIANNAIGRVLISGYAALVNVNASVTRGHYGTTHTVAKQATDGGASRVAGTFCWFLTGGTTPTALIYPVDLAGAALTNPMTTSQDIIVGGASGVPARLAIGAAGGILGRTNGSLAYLVGSSFPGSPATNDVYHRTDLACGWYRYDGTQWRCMGAHTMYLGSYDNQAADTALVRQPPIALGGTDLYLLSFAMTVFVVTTNDGTKYWNGVLTKVTAGDVGTTVSTITTQSLAPNNDLLVVGAINAALGTVATYKQLQAKFQKVSTAGNLYGGLTLTYQHIAT